MEENPYVIIGALIHNDKNKIFLATSHKWDHKWVVPGGHLDYGEKLFDCVKREVKEETNLDVTDIELIEVQESIFPVEYNKKKHMIFLNYICKAVNDDVQLNRELQEFKWVSPEALKLDLNSSTRQFIKTFIEKKAKMK